MSLLTNVQPTSRLFAVVVTDSGGLSATSSPFATLTVLTPPSITVQPTVQLMTPGDTALFTVTATGTAPLAYQWRFKDADLAGNTSRTLALPNAQPASVGGYSVVVANAYGAVTSRVAGLMFTAVHRIAGITANADRSIVLDTGGRRSQSFCSLLRPLSALSHHRPLGLDAG